MIRENRTGNNPRKICFNRYTTEETVQRLRALAAKWSSAEHACTMTDAFERCVEETHERETQR